MGDERASSLARFPATLLLEGAFLRVLLVTSLVVGVERLVRLVVQLLVILSFMFSVGQGTIGLHV